jgi:hypothetical protein
MAGRFKFQDLWGRHEKSRQFGRDVNPKGNRCALVLGATLRSQFKPRSERGELSFKEIEQPSKEIRGQPFLAKYYVKAQDFANRLREEWGPPDIRVVGPSAADRIRSLQGVIFVQDAWPTNIIGALINGNTVDHVDLWNGTSMGAYDEAESAEIFLRAKFVDLWLPTAEA